MIYWGSRGAMDIEGLGERTVMQLTAKGLIEDPADIYALTAEQVATLEGFASASAEKLVAAIADSKTDRCRACSRRSASSISGPLPRRCLPTSSERSTE